MYMVLKVPLQIFNGFWGDHHHWMFFGRSDHCHQWFYDGFLMLLPSLSMVFDGSGPLVKRCDGFDGSLWSNRVFSNMAEKWKKLDESLNLRDAGTACWWLWLAEIIDPVSLCWHISRAAWKKRGKKDAKRDERSWLRKDSQTKCAGNSVRWPNTSPMLLHL